MMSDPEAVLTELEKLVRAQLKCQDEVAALPSLGFEVDLEDQQRRLLQERIEAYRLHALRKLSQMVDFPARHQRHNAVLDSFWKDGRFDECVFIMTKFLEVDPAKRSDKDVQLERVVSVVSAAVENVGFKARIANQVQYHPILWDNVELHLLGCGRGIAIVEDRYLNELNPNVVMEWGWMRAMGRPVLFLVEEKFQGLRADVQGLISHNFAWDDPEPGIKTAVASWLKRTM